MGEWLFKRSDYRRPEFRLEHVDANIRFLEDRIEASGTLTLCAGRAADSVELDFEGSRKSFPIGRHVEPGERFTIDVANSFEPSDTVLYGIYRDTTAPGRPQQYMSQCQQFGFQRILPIIDDCTAKCTFRTVLEGDARYTHLISNGDLVGEELFAGPGGRAFRRTVYENRRAMAPYLFIACAGTWDVLEDEVVYPDCGKRVKLEYLVPPGRIEGAREPMRILKESVLFQHRLTGFVYPYKVYRTICMDKSLYGGMENTGNTTIITEAALIDETISDRRLVYAHGVIPHEYEHSHCGSGVTMESVFDMWLNEAYTVNVEREFLAEKFGQDWARALEIDDLRRTGGALAAEEGGAAAAVVREGVNDPDEVVDAITYDKAPEVLNTLRSLIGESDYRRAWEEYFRRFDGGNANTDDFLAVFSEASGRDVRALAGPYLFKTGFPTLSASWRWADGVLWATIERDGEFTVPLRWTIVKNGRDVGSGVFTVDGPRQSFSAPCPEAPDFISWNRGSGFYGVLKLDCSAEELERRVLEDPDCICRRDALATLRDRNEVDRWRRLYVRIFDSALPDGEKALLLSIGDDSLDRSRRGHVVENHLEMRALRRLAADSIGCRRIADALGTPPAGNDLSAGAIVRRGYEKALLELLAALDTPDAHAAITGYLENSVNITARLNALHALISTACPAKEALLERYGKELRGSLNGYIGWLGVVASDPFETLFDRVAAEERRPGWSIAHPGLSRALYCTAAANNARIWSERGQEWIEKKLVEYAKIGEYNALRMMAPLENFRSFPANLARRVRSTLERIAAALPADRFPAIAGRLEKLLARA